MASLSAVSMAMPLTYASQKRQPIAADFFFKPLPVRPYKTFAVPKPIARFQVYASLKEKAVTGLTAAAMTASVIMMPEVAEAAESSVSPSLKNFLLSILAGGVVLAALVGAIAAISNFDPVKRT